MTIFHKLMNYNWLLLQLAARPVSRAFINNRALRISKLAQFYICIEQYGIRFFSVLISSITCSISLKSGGCFMVLSRRILNAL